MFTEEEVQMIKAAIEYRANKVAGNGLIVKEEREILLNKYTIILTKLGSPLLVEVVGQ